MAICLQKWLHIDQWQLWLFNDQYDKGDENPVFSWSVRECEQHLPRKQICSKIAAHQARDMMLRPPNQTVLSCVSLGVGWCVCVCVWVCVWVSMCCSVCWCASVCIHWSTHTNVCVSYYILSGNTDSRCAHPFKLVHPWKTTVNAVRSMHPH